MMKLMIGLINYVFSAVGSLFRKNESYTNPPQQPTTPGATDQISENTGNIQPQTAPFTNKPKSLFRQKKFLIIIITVIALIISIFQISVSNNQQEEGITPTPSEENFTPTPSEDLTQQWIFYRNNQYGYALKHPPDFKISALADGLQPSENTTNARLIYIYNPQLEQSYINRHMSIEVLSSRPTYGSSWIKRDVIVNNIPAIKLTNTSQPTGFDIYHISTAKGQEILEIYVANASDKERLANQILSTLELIGSIP